MSKIYYPLNDSIGSIQLIQSVGDDTGIVNSARVSFGKRIDTIEDKDKKLIKYLLEHDHGSVFEHNSLTFLIKAPLFVIQQHLRHRISSFNQISARYVEIKEEFYIPENFRKQSKNNRQASIDDYVDEATELNDLKPSATTVRQAYKDVLNLAFENYKKMLEAGVCREQARGVLPHCTYSEYYWTCNLRSLLHFIKLRDHSGAQWEIQQYAKIMKEIAKEIFPETFKILEETK